MPVELNSTQLSPSPGQQVINVPMNIQLLFANGASINMSQSDIQITFNVNGRPIIATVMSIPVAKNIQVALLRALTDYERKTNTKVPE